MRISDWSSDVCSSDLEHLPVGSPIRGERFRAMRVCCDLALGGHALRHIQSTRFRTMEPNANSAQHQQSEHRQPHDQQEVPVAGAEIDGEQQLFRRSAAQQSRKGAAPHDQPADAMTPMQPDPTIEKGNGQVERTSDVWGKRWYRRVNWGG